MAGATILNRPVTFESNRNRPIRILIESQSFAGPYSNEQLKKVRDGDTVECCQKPAPKQKNINDYSLMGSCATVLD